MGDKDTSQGINEAIRLVLTYRKDAGMITLDESLLVKMRLLPSSELPETAEGMHVSGTWYELQTDRGEALYRQIIQDPTTAHVEYVSEKNKSRIVRKEAPIKEKTFVIDVPVIAGASRVVIFNVPADDMKKMRQWDIPVPASSEGGVR